MMQFRQVTIFFVLAFLKKTDVFCDDMDWMRSYKEISRKHFVRSTKPHKLVSFNPVGDVNLALEFAMPFITIPAGKSLNATRTSLVNINMNSLFVAGTVLFGSAVLLPLVLIFFNQKGLIPAQNPLKQLMGAANAGQNMHFQRYLGQLDDFLSSNGMDISACSQRAMCWAAKNSFQNVARGKGSNTEKIIDGIVSSEWIQNNLSSGFREAINSGQQGNDCSSVYRQCKPSSFYKLLKIVLNGVKG